MYNKSLHLTFSALLQNAGELKRYPDETLHP